MKRLRIVLPLILLIVAGAAYSQSLGDLAKKEKERRSKIKADIKVLTNDDTEHFKGASISTGGIAATESSPTKAGAGPTNPNAPGLPAKGPEASENEPVDFMGRPESFWRQTLADARQKITALENEGNVLTLRLADLQNQFYREASGFKQQDIQREIQKTYYEQDLNQKNLDKANAVLQDLETEARKSGALPGWLQPQTR